MSGPIAEFNAVTLAAFLRYVVIGGGLSCLASAGVLAVRNKDRAFAKYLLSTSMIIPYAIYVWWRLYIYIPRIGFSEHFMAWELGTCYGVFTLLAWWIGALVSAAVTSGTSQRRQAMAIGIGLLSGFLIGLVVTGHYQAAMGRGPVIPLHNLIIFPLVFALIGWWCGRKVPSRSRLERVA